MYEHIKSRGMPDIAPRSSNAPIFKGSGVSSFLEIYEMITIKNTDQQKTLLFPYYCDRSINDSLIKTTPYESRDWDSFKTMLLKRFKSDLDDVSVSNIEVLALTGFKNDKFEEFMYNFEYMSDKLISKGMISTTYRTNLLLRSVPSDLIDRISHKIYTDEEEMIDY
ncbi:hypothetical protein AYI69_g7354, partial [Smittium culicis]